MKRDKLRAGINGTSLFCFFSKICKIICKIAARTIAKIPRPIPAKAPIMAIIIVSASPIGSIISALFRFIQALATLFTIVIAPANINDITNGEFNKLSSNAIVFSVSNVLKIAKK
ncbi:putative typeIV pilus prepilin peptidase PilD [Campylobacter fetus subsp. venerealis NCTC 10354]|nr:putative typeIV pilus prepilin peptidase PilD [Campylobacter fetus subsp. venerealis NCTC 10354]